MVRKIIWRTLCMSGGLQAGVPKGLLAVTTLRVTVDAMPSGLRVGRKLPACVWLAFIIFSKPLGASALCGIFKAPATYGGDCGFSINATGLSESQKRDFGKLLI